MRPLDRFPHPEPPRSGRAPVLPFFLPFAGCPQRCIFCDQHGQTGQASEPLGAAFERLSGLLADLGGPDGLARPHELAFYGGTFTSLPAPWPQRFLALAAPHKAAGRLAAIRCSTRPDAVPLALLAELRALGLDTIELGVQSFDAAALAASQRGYSGDVARAACALVREAGLSLGVQLMPGLPGQTPEAFRRDIAQTAALKPDFARLYPCLVLEGTPLAELWRSGAYAPWSLDTALDALAEALRALWTANIAAARIGLAEQEGLRILAGPRHPALGQLARALALLLHVRQRLAALPASAGPADTLLVPSRWQGEALGQGNALRAEYAALGLAVRFHDAEEFALGVGG